MNWSMITEFTMVFIADNVSWIICYYVGLWINMIMYEKGLWKKGVDTKGLILHQCNSKMTDLCTLDSIFA